MPRISKKEKLLKKYQKTETDTGSTAVQILVITNKIAELAAHLRKHKKDFDSKVGLLKMIGKRRRLLNYLQRSDEKEYKKLIKDLNLRR